MKNALYLVGFCLLAGLVSADSAWQHGKSYRYKVNSRALAGISEIGNKYAGLQLIYDQIVTPMGGNTVHVKIENLEVTQVDEELEQGWRQTPINEGQQVNIPAKLKGYLTSPFEMVVVKGVVTSIRVQQNLPTWAINIKKAQASSFILDTTGKNAVVEYNLNRQINAVRPEEQNQESGFFYKVFEQSVHGECEVYYTASEHGPFDFPYQFQKQAQAAQQSGRAGQQQQQQSFFSSSSSSSEQQQGQQQSQSQESNSASSVSSEEIEGGSSVEMSWPQAFTQLCKRNDQIYEFIKTVNFTTCTQKPVLAFSSPAQLNFRPGDNAGGSLWTRALITRVLTCGQSRRNFTILKITQQELFQSGLQDKEKVVAGAQKNMTLISIGSSHPTPLKNPLTINNLVYTHPQNQGQQSSSQSSEQQEQHQESSSEEENSSNVQQGRGQGQSVESAEEATESLVESAEEAAESLASGEITGPGQLPRPSLQESPLTPFLIITPLDRRGMKKRAQVLLLEVVEDLVVRKDAESDSIAKRQTLSKITSLVKALRFLNQRQIHNLLQEILQGQGQRSVVGKQIIVESLAIAGTNPALQELFALIQAGKLRGEAAAHLISTVPMYIRTPTRQIILQLCKLMQNEAIKGQVQTRTSAILAFTTLVHQACVNKKTKNTRYPVALYGELCQPQFAQDKARHFIQKLEQHLEQNQPQDKHWIFVYFKALSNLGVPEVIPIIQKTLDEKFDPIIKFQAIYALQNLLEPRDTSNKEQIGKHQQPISADHQSYDVVTGELVEKKVLPILTSVAFNRGQHPMVRIAALESLFFCTYADVALWQQIAMSTWFEQSRDIRAFIYSTVHSFAELQQPLEGTTWTQIQKARKVINLVKPIDASIARSNNIFTSRFVRPINSGFAQQVQYTASPDSIIPTNMYYKNFYQYGNGAARVNGFEVALTGQTISKLIYAAYERFLQNSHEGPQGNAQLHHIREFLGIRKRKQEEPVVGNLFVNVRGEVQRMWTFDEQMVQQLSKTLVDNLQNLEGKKQLPINHHRVYQVAEHIASMPTILGFPMVYNARMMGLVSLRGNVEMKNPSGPEFQVQADLSPVLGWKIHRLISFKVPFTGRKYQSGLQREFVAELPVSVVARRASRGYIQLAVTPQHFNTELKGSPKGTVDLFTYQQKPYIAIVTDEFYPVGVPQGVQMQVVRVKSEEQQQFSRSRSFGRKTLGLHLQVQEKSDYPKETESFSGWASLLQRFQTLITAINTAWIGSGSISFVERKVVLNLDESEAKTVLLVAGIAPELSSVPNKDQTTQGGLPETSGSSSSSQSQEGQGFGSEESNEGARPLPSEILPRTHVVTFALVGKADPLLSLVGQGEGQEEQESSSSSLEQGREEQQPSASQEKGNEEEGGLQRPLQIGSENVRDYLLQTAFSAPGTLFVELSAGDAANQTLDFPENSGGLQGVYESINKSPRSRSQASGCIELSGSLLSPEFAYPQGIAYTRGFLLEQDLSVKVDAKLQAGQHCLRSHWPLFVEIQGTLRRDQEMTEWARFKSPKAQRCEADEKKGFSVSQVCLEVAREQAAALNEMELNIQHSQLPDPVKNYTTKLETFLKALGYLYLSENQNPESSPVGQNQMKLWARMTPNKQFLSVHISQPDSILKFENIKTNKVARAVLPPTATNTLVENVQRRLLHSQFHPTCQLENNWVNTFDNVTYSFSRNAVQGCDTVLVKDCSGRYPMAVLARNFQTKFQNQLVTILLGQETKIELKGLIPVRRGATEGSETSFMTKILVASVNGRNVPLPHVVPAQGSESGEPIAEIMRIHNGGIQVNGHRIKVAFDGQRIVLRVHELLRNRTCGICGDFDSEKVAEMRSPKDVPLSSGSLLVASYSLSLQEEQNKGTSSTQCQIRCDLQRQVEKEEGAFLSEQGSSSIVENQQGGKLNLPQQHQASPSLGATRPAKYTTQEMENQQGGKLNLPQQHQASPSLGASRPAKYTTQEIVFAQRVVPQRNGKELCFTVNRIPKCAPGYKPSSKRIEMKLTAANCMPAGAEALELKREIQNGKVVNIPRENLKTIQVEIPQKCLKT